MAKSYRKILPTTVIRKYMLNRRSIKGRELWRSWVEKNFRHIGCGAYSDVYSNAEVDYVIKLADHGHLKAPKIGHPLHALFMHPIWINRSRSVMIQPKVKLPLARVRERITSDMIAIVGSTKYDIHHNNVGVTIAEEKPVIFDY